MEKNNVKKFMWLDLLFQVMFVLNVDRYTQITSLQIHLALKFCI